MKQTVEELNTTNLNITRCKTCNKQISPPPKKCVCSAGGPGKSGGGDGGARSAAGQSGSTTGDKLTSSGSPNEETTATQAHEDVDLLTMAEEPKLSSEPLFNQEIISELLASKILTIDNNAEIGTLTIACKPNFKLSDEKKLELEKFFTAVLTELNNFKSDEKRAGYNISSISGVTKKGDDGSILSLTVKISDPRQYDRFIRHLAGKNLLPIANIHQQKNNHGQVKYPKDITNYFNPQPTPSRKAGNLDEHQGIETARHKISPFSTKLKPPYKKND